MFRLDLRPDEFDDAAVCAALDYLWDISAAGSQKEMNAARERHPLITVARGVYRDAGAVRELVESMLWAEVDITDIAAATGLSTEAVNAYEILFFHVAHPIDPLEFPMGEPATTGRGFPTASFFGE